jgi:inositol 1,4,5-triphosphate receptor type 3
MKNQLTMAKALQVHQGGFWLSRGAEIEEGVYAIRVNKDKDKAMSLLINECVLCSMFFLPFLVCDGLFGSLLPIYCSLLALSDTTWHESNHHSHPSINHQSTQYSHHLLLPYRYMQFSVDGPTNNKEPNDAFTGMSIKRSMWKFLNMTSIPRRKNVTTLWPDADQTEVDFFAYLTTRAKNFSQGFNITDGHVTLGVDKSNQLLRTQRQNLMRELGIIEVTLRIINRLKPLTAMFDRSESRGQPLADSDKQLLAFGNIILTQLLDLVYYCILDNASNQMYVFCHSVILLSLLLFSFVMSVSVSLSSIYYSLLAFSDTTWRLTIIPIPQSINTILTILLQYRYVADYLPDLLAHLSTQPLAGKCVTAMLSVNMDLQEDKINKAVLSIFVDKLKSTQMSRMYLNLLQACCSCQGQGVDGNQCDVADLLFEDTAGVIIEPRVNNEARTMVEWKDSLFIPPVGSESVVEGLTLRTKGLPEVSLTWDSRDDYSAKTLFGKDLVSIMDIFPRNLKMNPVTDLDKKRLAVAMYFIDEMYLGAEMCMDRNYVSMHLLDPLFSFELLVTMMKMPEVHYSLKAAACRLLYCLHVDRDPQACTKIPCLTRTWDDVVNSVEPKLPSVEPERLYVYGLIQQLCSEHVRGMCGHRWDVYSRSVLQMLRGMIGFNFYGSVERLQDVIAPMMNAIDRRLVDYSDAKLMSRKSSVSVMKIDGQDILVDREDSWQKRHYDFLESLPAMCAILVLVLGAVAVTIYQVIMDVSDAAGYLYFGILVLAIFLYDFFMRLGCYYYVYREWVPFMSNPYNIIDTCVILIDVAFLVIPTEAIGSEGGIAKSLRLVRLVRLVRVLRAVKVIDAITKDKDEVVKWNAPIRYTKIPMFELETMTEAISLLLFTQGVIEDRNLSILLRYFHAWEKGEETRSPTELFEQALEDSQELTLDVNEMNHVLIDGLMFVHSPLVQGSLDVLMAHHSSKEILLENAANAQIIASAKRQKEFVKIRQWVATLEQNAETHELWGELQSEEDHHLNKATKEILRELIACVRTSRYTFEFDQDYEPVSEVQNMLRNLGIYDITPKVMGLMESVEEDDDGNFSDVAKNTKDICTLCNELLYWSTIGNAANQEILYDNLGEFIDSLSDDINSHKVVKAIFKGNEALMGIVPHSLLNDMVSNICNEGHSHTYLALASAITHVGEKNITKNQFEIIRGLCNPEKIEETAVFLVSVDHDDYFEKKRLMAPFKETQDVDIDTLPPLLAYHLQYLEVLSNCTSGKINISAVEAKVQSIFGIKDIIDAILDEDTILIAKIRLSQFLLNSIIDVDMALPGLTESKHMWLLLESYLELLSFAKDEVRSVEKLGWESPEVSRHRIEYIITSINIIGSFFEKNYSAEKMRADDGTASEDRASLSMLRVNDIIRQLFDKIFELYDLDTPRLDTPTKATLYDCLTALNKSASAIIVTNIDPIHLESEGVEEEEPEADELYEQQVLGKYMEFCSALQNDEGVQESATKQVDEFISLMEDLPSITDKSATTDIRIEPFLQKLVLHVRENTVTSEAEKKMDSATIKTTLWLIKAFRTWIENKMEMSIYDRDDDGGEEEDEKAGPTVGLFNDNHITALCLELISPGIDETLQSEALKLLVGMLFKEGGARDVQQRVFECLTATDSSLFFKQVRTTIQKLISWHSWNDIIILEKGEDPEPPADIIVIRMLQLLCEGHFLPNQDILRDQPHNTASINLMDDFATYFNVLSRIPCRTSTFAADAVGNVIVEVIQGPCTGNQTHFALNTEVLETINRVLRMEPLNDCDGGEDNGVKQCCLDLISALLEGQKPHDAVTVRILSVIHLDILLYLATPKAIAEEGDEDSEAVKKIEEKEKEKEKEEEGEGEEEEEEDDGLQTDCVVLLQMLCDYKPSLREEIDAETDGVFDFDVVAESTASIEVNWNGVLNRRFFHIPDVCFLLSKPSKDKMVMDIDRSNTENRLLDFLDRAKHLYLEIKHQEYLTELGVAKVFSPATQNSATWITFCLALVINVLFVVYYEQHADYDYEFPDATDPIIPTDIRTVISALNYIQISISVFTIILNLVVKSPVICAGFMEEGMGIYSAILYTAMDGMTLYYLWYLLFACLGAFYEDIYITYLLLDLIVKNPTTADILNAVVIPADSLIVAFIMGAFVIYIYTFFIFIFMPYRITADDDMTPGGMDGMNCVTLWGCYKYVFAYGFRAGGGVGEVMFVDVGDAVWLHLTFFLVVTVAMLNIIFGIIIDTFSGLRSDKNERAFKTTETCFVCSLGRQVFDRAANSPEGFKRHIREDHNMWNYLYFIFFLWEQDKDDDDGLEYVFCYTIVLPSILVCLSLSYPYCSLPASIL